MVSNNSALNNMAKDCIRHTLQPRLLAYDFFKETRYSLIPTINNHYR